MFVWYPQWVPTEQSLALTSAPGFAVREAVTARIALHGAHRGAYLGRTRPLAAGSVPLTAMAKCALSALTLTLVQKP